MIIIKVWNDAPKIILETEKTLKTLSTGQIYKKTKKPKKLKTPKKPRFFPTLPPGGRSHALRGQDHRSRPGRHAGQLIERKKEYLFIFLRHVHASGIAIGTVCYIKVNTLVGKCIYIFSLQNLALLYVLAIYGPMIYTASHVMLF